MARHVGETTAAASPATTRSTRVIVKSSHGTEGEHAQARDEKGLAVDAVGDHRENRCAHGEREAERGHQLSCRAG